MIIIPGLGVSRLYDPIDGRWVWGAPRTMVITSYEDDLDLPLNNDGEIGVDRLDPQGFAGSRGSVNTARELGATSIFAFDLPIVDFQSFFAGTIYFS